MPGGYSFSRHYDGTVAAKPLYVMLAGMYFDRNEDIETIEAIG